MLGDIIKRGKACESQRIRVWKARCEVEQARRDVVARLSCLSFDRTKRGEVGEMAQMAVEMERDEVERRLEDAEYRFLCERDGWSALNWVRAERRAKIFLLNAFLTASEGLFGPMHPIDVSPGD